MLEQKPTLDDIATSMSTEFDISIEAAREDAIELVDNLGSKGLIRTID